MNYKFATILVLSILILPAKTEAVSAGHVILSPAFCNENNRNYPNCRVFHDTIDDLLLTPPNVNATTTVDVFSVCAVYTEGEDNGLHFFDKFGTRLSQGFTNTVFWSRSYSCYAANNHTINGASTTEFSVYWDNPGDYCSQNPGANLSLCESNGGTDFDYLRTYRLSAFGEWYYWDSISGNGKPFFKIDSNMGDQVALAFMTPILKQTIGAGFGVLSVLIPFVIGFVIISTIIYFLYLGFRFINMKH